MKRIDDDTIALTQQELDEIRDFIRMTLDRDYDRHTSQYYGSKRTWEEGLRYMDPQMYDFAEQIAAI